MQTNHFRPLVSLALAIPLLLAASAVQACRPYGAMSPLPPADVKAWEQLRSEFKGRRAEIEKQGRKPVAADFRALTPADMALLERIAKHRMGLPDESDWFHGRVVHAKTGQPIPGTRIELDVIEGGALDVSHVQRTVMVGADGAFDMVLPESTKAVIHAGEGYVSWAPLEGGEIKSPMLNFETAKAGAAAMALELSDRHSRWDDWVSGVRVELMPLSEMTLLDERQVVLHFDSQAKRPLTGFIFAPGDRPKDRPMRPVVRDYGVDPWDYILTGAGMRELPSPLSPDELAEHKKLRPPPKDLPERLVKELEQMGINAGDLGPMVLVIPEMDGEKVAMVEEPYVDLYPNKEAYLKAKNEHRRLAKIIAADIHAWVDPRDGRLDEGCDENGRPLRTGSPEQREKARKHKDYPAYKAAEKQWIEEHVTMMKFLDTLKIHPDDEWSSRERPRKVRLIALGEGDGFLRVPIQDLYLDSRMPSLETQMAEAPKEGFEKEIVLDAARASLRHPVYPPYYCRLGGRYGRMVVGGVEAYGSDSDYAKRANLWARIPLDKARDYVPVVPQALLEPTGTVHARKLFLSRGMHEFYVDPERHLFGFGISMQMQPDGTGNLRTYKYW